MLRRPGEPPVRMWLRCGYYVVTSGSRRPGEPPVPCRLDTSLRSPCRSPAVRFVDGVRGGDGGGICGVHRSCGRGACSVLGAGSSARDGATALGAGSSARDGATVLGAGSSGTEAMPSCGAEGMLSSIKRAARGVIATPRSPDILDTSRGRARASLWA